MKRLRFAIEIQAPREKVWDTMLSDSTYRQWSTAFSPGSYYKGDWSAGSKILFLGPDPQTGEEGGMVSKIVENKLHEYISIEHVGLIINGREDTTSEEVKKWFSEPAFENYTFTERNGTTELVIELDSVDEMVADFEKMWPEALQQLKKLAETA